MCIFNLSFDNIQLERKKNMNQKKIGEFIAKKRKQKKLTQEVLAEKLNVSKNAVSKWERGICLMDMSLLKPLSEILEVSINELLNGVELDEKQYIEKFEKTIAKTLEYSDKKIKTRSRIIYLLLVIFGLLVTISAVIIFPSSSSWSSIYAGIGIVVFLIGIGLMIKHLNWIKKIIIMVSTVFIVLTVLLLSDYISVILNHQVPRFRLSVLWSTPNVYYDTFLYDVYRCDANTEKESWHIVSNHYGNLKDMRTYCNQVTEERLKKTVATLENTKMIVLSKMVFQTDSQKQYVKDGNFVTHEVIGRIDNPQKIKQIIDILKRVHYTENIDSIEYLFQCYDANNQLLAEFKYNNLYNGTENFSIEFDRKERQLLEMLVTSLES